MKLTHCLPGKRRCIRGVGVIYNCGFDPGSERTMACFLDLFGPETYKAFARVGPSGSRFRRRNEFGVI